MQGISRRAGHVARRRGRARATRSRLRAARQPRVGCGNTGEVHAGLTPSVPINTRPGLPRKWPRVFYCPGLSTEYGLLAESGYAPVSDTGAARHEGSTASGPTRLGIGRVGDVKGGDRFSSSAAGHWRSQEFSAACRAVDHGFESLGGTRFFQCPKPIV